MKYMIHACNQRMWYVNEFLIPSMEKQGISREDIIVHCDYENLGNLKSFVLACQKAVNYKEGLWHLQDDVIISSRFAEVTKQFENYPIVVNGFVTKSFNENNWKYCGTQPFGKHWLSFQCIYIPQKYIRKFLVWFADILDKGLYADKIQKNKYDDYMFWKAVGNKTVKVFNIAPNIVDHVDYLIGGTTINMHHKPENRSAWWVEENLVDELKETLSVSKKRI